jgi:hypothetical protein
MKNAPLSSRAAGFQERAGTLWVRERSYFQNGAGFNAPKAKRLEMTGCFSENAYVGAGAKLSDRAAREGRT